MDFLVINRRVVTLGRKIVLAVGACIDLCCGGSPPKCRVFYRYDPCPLDPETHVQCMESVRTTPVYMRCDVKCPGGCGAADDLTVPRGIKYREWCHSGQIRSDGVPGLQQYYDPADFPPPDRPPPGALPLPANAELVASPQWCIERENPCGSECCKCWRWYCGAPCGCAGPGGPQKCVRGSQNFFDTRRDNPCIVGSCTEFNSPIGLDALPPDADIVGVQAGTCCSQHSGCAALGLCEDCQNVTGQYEFSVNVPCSGDPSPPVVIDFDCCCSALDTNVEFAYEAVRRYIPGCASERLAVARGRAFGAVGSVVQMDVELVVYYDNGQDRFVIPVFIGIGCSPLSNLVGLKNATDGILGFIGSSIHTSIASDCTVANSTISLTGCPNEDGTSGPCTGSTLTKIHGVTHFNGPRSQACRSGCRNGRRFSSTRRRRIPSPLELMG